ncbi:trypsin-like peptidase domain-containing protein [Actinoplanes sp. KI2]|uniref:trypsin-like serine peptidase n=1 Tax=Actinoplanes sp. KI2 TaxID=2983315 RepID=UPI0021D5EAB4|nr:trypsin-like peptidase domain-containing protein [Actinoplanes sp. KI2]MCU7727211.1 trypsin-like peptidase domain-containing protein [Actinoplanes sp. KI2]
MRRTAGIAVGACAVLVLGAAAGVTAWNTGGDRAIGTWHEAPAAELAQQAATPQPTAAPTDAGQDTTPQLSPSQSNPSQPNPSQPSPGQSGPGEPSPSRVERGERKPAAATDGRERVGELLRVDRVLDYVGKGLQRETFRYPGASYVKVHFDRMDMLPGDYVTVTNADGTESYRYDAPRGRGSGSVDKWAMSVTGEAAVLEMHRTSDVFGVGAKRHTLGVNVDRVVRGFTGSQQTRQPEGQLTRPGTTGREESVCGADTSTDAVCYRSSDPVAYTKSKAIARLLINGTELCTSWRVGPNNRMLTNNHCLTTSAEAQDTEVWFNYQCATCGGYDIFQPTKVWGSKVLSTDHAYDYTLFTVDNFSAVQKFGYLTLDTARPAKGQELYVPQHPAGQPTRIAGSLGEKAGNCAVADPNYTGYAAGSDVSYYCDTEGGSSGSPVLSRATNKVVALHHFGGCPNSGVRGDLLAARLRSLL